MHFIVFQKLISCILSYFINIFRIFNSVEDKIRLGNKNKYKYILYFSRLLLSLQLKYNEL